MNVDIGRHTDELDPTWQEFLHHTVNSFVKWDLVRFFHDNPHTVDTAEHIAKFISRDVETVLQELDALVDAKVLKRKEVNNHQIYAFTSTKKIRQRIQDFMIACQDRNFRVKAIHHVIHQ